MKTRVLGFGRSSVDVYLFPETLVDYERLLGAVQDGRLSKERVRDAARRVLELKARLNVHIDPFGPKPSTADLNRYQERAQAVADKSMPCCAVATSFRLRCNQGAASSP
ncbi:MAG: hypothetical protein R3A44_11385 [Caldilineaceae bacterium]